MANNASGFVDFEQFAGLNADDEARLFEQAMAEAEKATVAERAALSKSEREAGGRYGKTGEIEGQVSDISQTASYSDYLKAKRDAASAWAKMGARSSDPRLAAVQGAAMTPEQRAAMGASGGLAAQREAAASERTGKAFAGNQRISAERAAAAKAKSDAESARRGEDADRRRGQLASIGDPRGWQQGWMRPGVEMEDAQQKAQQWLNLGGDPNSAEGQMATKLRGNSYEDNPFKDSSDFFNTKGQGH